jgi:hypothetical protein
VSAKEKGNIVKKFLLCTLVLLPLCLLTGCTKNYKTVSEYSAAMSEVRNNLGDYTIEADLLSGNKNLYVKSLCKNDLWKAETSNDNGKTYVNTLLYDGKEIYTYAKGQPIAVSIPFKKMITTQGSDNNDAEKAVKWMNPLGVTYNWDLYLKEDDINKTFELGKIVKKNGFDCRMVTYINGDGEFCISDKYGIAVYAKLTDKTKNQTMEINVKSIDNAMLNPSDFELPAGIKKMSMVTLMQNMLGAMQK